jgi:hypothetical protein
MHAFFVGKRLTGLASNVERIHSDRRRKGTVLPAGGAPKGILEAMSGVKPAPLGRRVELTPPDKPYGNWPPGCWETAHDHVVDRAAAAVLGHVHREQAHLLRLAAYALECLGRHGAEGTASFSSGCTSCVPKRRAASTSSCVSEGTETSNMGW